MEIAAYRHALGRRAPQLRQVAAQEHDAIGVIDQPVGGMRERISRSTRIVHGLVLYSYPPQATTLCPSRMDVSTMFENLGDQLWRQSHTPKKRCDRYAGALETRDSQAGEAPLRR